MTELSANVIAWEEGEPALQLLAPEQAMTAVVSSRLGQVFFLTEDGRVYLSTLKQDGLSGKLQELALPCQTVVGIACNSSHTIFVTDRGRVLRSELETPEKVEELAIKQPNLCCPHGVVEDGGRLFVREVASHSKNLLFISDSGKVWAVDEAKSLLPEKLPAFENKTPVSIMCGSNFSIALIQDCENPGDNKPASKSSWDSLDGAHISKSAPFDGVCVVGSCLECREQSILSLNTLDLNGHQQEDLKDNVNSLAQVCWSKADHLVRQSALLLNSTPQHDAAKQFLTKQLSWVTGSDDDNGPASSLESGNNVTQQVASRVVEGVRNLGDAVVNRMSRHWSGTSQEETPIPSTVAAAPIEAETLSLPVGLPSSGEDSPVAPATPRFIVRQPLHRWKRNGSSSLSLDSTIIRMISREKSTGLRPERLLTLGRQLLRTSVWTWGQGGVGQLGLSDCVSREAPTSVKHLLGIGTFKVSCGSRHSLALTLDGRVLAWGANNKGQVEPGEDLSFFSTPTEVSLPFRTTIRDIAAGRYFDYTKRCVILLTTQFFYREHSLLLTSHGEVLFMGFSMATQKSTLMRLNLPAQSPTGRPSRVWATGPLSCCLRCNQSCCCWPHWSEFVLSEQLFLRSCLKVCKGILDHLEAPTTSAIRRELFDRYRDLVACTAVNVHSLIDSDNCSNLSIAIVHWVGEYMQVWREYGRVLCNATVVHSLALSKTENALLDPEFIQQGGVGRSGGDFFNTLMNEPLGRLKEYAAHLEKLIESHVDRNDTDCYKLASQQCLDVSAVLLHECQSADTTRAFWDSCSAKLTGI